MIRTFTNWEDVPLFDSEEGETSFWAENRPALRLMEAALAGNTGDSAESVTITLRIDPRMLARIKRLANSSGCSAAGLGAAPGLGAPRAGSTGRVSSAQRDDSMTAHPINTMARSRNTSTAPSRYEVGHEQAILHRDRRSCANAISG